jgi:hypothetical protein
VLSVWMVRGHLGKRGVKYLTTEVFGVYIGFLAEEEGDYLVGVFEGYCYHEGSPA